MLRSLILSIRCRRNASGNLAHCWIFGITSEDHLSELLTKALDLLRIGCGSKMLGKFKERLFLCFFASMPSSRSSTSIRLALSRWRFAMLRTWVATFTGSVTLWRTVLPLGVMTPVCTTMVHIGSDFRIFTLRRIQSARQVHRYRMARRKARGLAAQAEHENGN